MNAGLPKNATATDIIDFVSDAVAELVLSINGRSITKTQFQTAFDQTFPVALDKFLAGLEAERPDLAQQIRTEFTAEEDDRRA